jgi:hypothetical protein
MKPNQEDRRSSHTPDVVSFVRGRLADCDLRCGSGIRDVAWEASFIASQPGQLAGDVRFYVF